jgi:hypothetical protein
LYHGRSEEAIRHSQAALDAVDGRPPNKGLLPLIPFGLVRAHLHAGDIDGARGAITRACGYSSGNLVVDEIRNPSLTALVAAFDGDLGRARQLAAQVERRADELHLGIYEPGRIWVGMAKVEIHLERNELEDAAAAIDAVRASADATHRTSFQSHVILQHARLARALGDPVAADALLMQASLLFSDPDRAARSVFAMEAAHQALRFDPEKAATLIDALDQDRVETQILRARLLLVDGHSEPRGCTDPPTGGFSRRLQSNDNATRVDLSEAGYRSQRPPESVLLNPSTGPPMDPARYKLLMSYARRIQPRRRTDRSVEKGAAPNGDHTNACRR